MVEKKSKVYNTLRHVKIVRNSSFGVHKKSFMFWIQPCPFVYILSTAVFALWWQNWVVVTKSVCIQNLKYLLSGPWDRNRRIRRIRNQRSEKLNLWQMSFAQRLAAELTLFKTEQIYSKNVQIVTMRLKPKKLVDD